MVTIEQIMSRIASGESSATKEVELALSRAKDNQSYHALLELTAERALERAKMVDEGKLNGRLAGVPFVVKDNFLAFGAPTTAASKMLEGFESPYQATVVEKLEAEGAICIGKANLDSFAHGGSTENSAFGPTKNAVDTERVAGGSSGGSAVVTALGVVPFALGSDTGGSIRQPASFNGVYGMKPTYGMTSRYGVVAMASSTDTMGCFANTAKDLSLVLGIMSGRDDRDMTSLPDYFDDDIKPVKKMKIGIIKETVDSSVDGSVLEVVEDFSNQLKAKGHTVEEVSLPIIKHTLAAYYIITSAEISSNLARFDGVRYGHRSSRSDSLAELYSLSRSEGFMAENKRRILIGSFVLSQGFFDAYYLQAQKVRTLLIESFDKLFEQFDVLMTPTAATPAFRLGENTEDPLKMYLTDIMTVPASLAGLPAISVPAGQDNNGLPIGVQLMSPRQTDSSLLSLVDSVEGGAV